MTDGTPRLRDLNKLRTRQGISDVATRLFLERGYDRVTIAEIAAAAGVAKQTVTNHFPRKEDLVLDIHEEFVAAPARAVADRAAGESALTALRSEFFALLDARSPLLGFSGPEFAALLLSGPALRARLRELHDDRERSLAAALARETGAPGGDPGPRLAAAHLLTPHRVLFYDVLHGLSRGEDAETVAARVAEAAGAAFALLEPAFAAYARRPSP
ncbi:TetR/AcrR family transcriptional regulator [Bailinhaonella thermotolerans]|uniref:TetR family transcriptional regulator n=1 Tax=Bailinhaonella thermotolerans TaxID=1070861 RepID=A0A3A4A1B0_9ACTN|nr:TetR/AcrR family transcriptional regulator [Bailinhaonella thermotolerans]RJL20843.1 TetR family transcriptional regulator [Bailinhaonella thermotolerans]